MGTLAADQERVKKLLTEAVTLLCRSSLTFSEEVAVEGLLGITLDKRDVFLVGIKEKIQQGIQAALVGGLEEESETEEAPLSKKRKSRKRKKRRRSGSSAETDASDAENNALSKRSKDEEQSMSDNIGDYPANVKSELSEQIAESQLSPTHSDSANDSQDTNTLTPAKVKLEKQDYDEDDCLLVDDGNNSNAWADGSQDSTNQFNLSGASNQFNISQGALFSPDGMPSTSGDMNDSVNRQKSGPHVCRKCHRCYLYIKPFRKHIKQCSGALGDNYVADEHNDDVTVKEAHKFAKNAIMSSFKDIAISMIPGMTASEYRDSLKGRGRDGSYCCKSCGKSYSHPRGLQRHITNVHMNEDGGYPCSMCSKVLSRRDHLHRHLLNVHNMVRCFKCPNMCGFTAESERSVRVHLLSQKCLSDSMDPERVALLISGTEPIQAVMSEAFPSRKNEESLMKRDFTSLKNLGSIYVQNFPSDQDNFSESQEESSSAYVSDQQENTSSMRRSMKPTRVNRVDQAKDPDLASAESDDEDKNDATNSFPSHRRESHKRVIKPSQIILDIAEGTLHPDLNTK